MNDKQPRANVRLVSKTTSGSILDHLMNLNKTKMHNAHGDQGGYTGKKIGYLYYIGEYIKLPLSCI